MEIENLYSNELKRVLDFMITKLVEDNPTLEVGLEYFLLSILENTDSLSYKLLNSYLSSVVLDTIHSSYYEIIQKKALITIKPNREVKYSEEFLDYVLKANGERMLFGDDKLTTEHVLLSILNPENPDNKIRQFFKTTALTYPIFLDLVSKSRDESNEEFDDYSQNIVNDVIEKNSNTLNSKERFNKAKNKSKSNDFISFSSEPTTSVIGTFSSGKKNKGTYIKQYCTNLNELAQKGKIDKLVGREKEIKQIINTLSRRKKNNVVLVGENGCGKTIICENLAQLIVDGKLPNSFLNKEIVSLDITSIISGTQWRGMLEERIKGIIDELKNSKNYILFIDNIHNILADKGRGDVDIASMFIPILTGGEVQVIGTTSYNDYKGIFSKRSTLSNKFHKIIIDAPSINESIEILNNIKGYYEKFHHVKYPKNVIKLCVSLANKYNPERSLPDSAIDLMDEVGAANNIGNNEPEDIKEMYEKLAEIKAQKDECIKNDNYDDLDKVKGIENQLKIELSDLEHQYKKISNSKIEILEDDVYNIIAEKTNIPVSKLTKDDKKNLFEINNVLKKYIIGQDEAIDSVCKIIKRNRIGLSSHSKTIGNVFFCGETGCGKTLLAKKLAKEIFGDEKYLVRFDMSEYSDKTSINKLIGAGAGYVGFEQGGRLTEIIKNKKHCVLLLDEFEKSDPQIFNIFLQLFDEGYLTDNTGEKVDFRNVLVILTSNIGAKEASERGNGIGFITNDTINRQSIIEKELKKKFPPEFINRLDDIINFNRLTDNNLKDIIKVELNDLKERVENIKHKLEYNDDIIEFIYNIIKDQKEYGARPIKRAIQDEIENKITDLLLINDYQKHTFKCNVNDSGILEID